MNRVLSVALLLLTSGLWAAPTLSDVLGSLPSGKAAPLTLAQVTQLLSVAAQQKWNIFDLLDEAGLYLKARNKRVVIGGVELRSAAQAFKLGGTRVDVLLPLALVVSVSAGARLETDAEVEVRLSKPFSAFLELGDFDLATSYGFREVKDKELDRGFGVTVRKGLLRWNMSKVARVADPTGGTSPNFIAIHLDGFFRPKRWKIDPITAAAPPPKQKASS